MLILVAIASTIPLITRREQLGATLLLFCGFFAVIFLLTAFFWDHIPRPTLSRSHYMLELSEVGVLFLCLCAVTFLAISSYRREKDLVSSLNLELSREKESLEKSHRELQLAYSEIKTLRGLLPTCSYCKKIRPDYIQPNEARPWVPIEKFIEQHTDAFFSHGICPECTKEHFGQDIHDDIFAHSIKI